MGKRSKETNRLSRRVLGMALASSMAFAFLPVAGAADGPEGAADPFAAMYDSGALIQERIEAGIAAGERGAYLRESVSSAKRAKDMDYGQDRYIVKYKEPDSPSLAGFAAASGAQAKALPGSGGGRVELLVLAEKANPKTLADGLRSAGAGQEIEFMQPDFALELNGFSQGDDIEGEGTGDAADDWGLAESGGALNRPSAIVAVIDAGVDVSHPALAGHIADAWNATNQTNAVYDPACPNEAAHGTHVSGLVVEAAAEGGAYATVIPIKAFHNGSAYTSDILAAIAYAESHGARIINCSFGSSAENQALREAIEGSGALFVCAAGNARRDLALAPVYPACYSLPNVISVASANADLGFSYFSNYGPVDIAARGRDAVSALPGGKYGTMSGTSMAAGYVAGAAAAVEALAGMEGAGLLRERLLHAADRLDNLEGKVSGRRHLNLANALSGDAGADLSPCPADDFDAHGYDPTESELFELYSMSNVVQVCAGWGHTLALKGDGTVFAWGDNYFGQCGVGYAGGTWEFGQVIGLSDVVQIASGDFISAALKSDGTVWIWGMGTGPGAWDSGVPMQIWELVGSTSITMNGDSFMGMFGGQPYEWAIDVGSLYYIYVSGAKAAIAGLGVKFILDEYGALYKNDGGTSLWDPVFYDAENASAGLGHTAIVKNDQTVWLLDNQTDAAYGVQGLSGFADAVAGVDFCLAVKGDGTVWQITNSTGAYTQANGLSGVVSVSIGYGHCLALRADGLIYGWGSDDYGQLMNTLAPGSGPAYHDGTYAFSVAAGSQYTVLINAADMLALTSATFTLTYDPGMLTLLDSATQIGVDGLSPGFFSGVPLTVVSHEDGVLTLAFIASASPGLFWSGVLAALRFDALASGNATIWYDRLPS